VKCLILLFAAVPAEGADVRFSEEIRPLLSDKCFRCHGPDANSRQADLRLDHRQSATRDLGGRRAIVPHDARQSELVRRIFSHDPDLRMPPPESNLTLTNAEKFALRAWIDAGADYPDHWAFVRPVRPRVPGDDSHPHPIDAFVQARLAAAGLAFSPEASPSQLIRRVTLDLTGLPPTIAEVEAFVTAYAEHGDKAYAALVDRLIASPRYGETMALPWLDAARYADTDGYQYDGPRYQWRWRDWVIAAYNANMPFDQFTIEQLAGDLLPAPTLDQMIATGFNRNHRYNSEEGLVVEEFLLENAVDRVDTTATVWMGLTMGCARCHDHKYDPISQQDYYQLIAFFNNVPEAGRAIKEGNSEPTIAAPTPTQQAELKRRRQAVTAAWEEVVAHDAAAPGDDPTALLIDRKLVHRFATDQVVLDGRSTVEFRDLDKTLTYAANRPFSLSFWLRPDLLADGVILSRQNLGTTRPGIELAMLEDGRLQFDLIARWVGSAGRATTKIPLNPGVWQHVTITNDGSQSANGQLIFLDGRPVETIVSLNTNSNPGGVGAGRPLILGGGIRPGSRKFQGSLRDLRLYRTALWPEEIAILGAGPDADERRRFAPRRATPAYAHYVELREALEAFEKTLPTVMVMRENPTPKPTYLRHRGVYNAYAKQVDRDVPTHLPPLAEDLPRNRLGLAKWLMAPEHPLTARVAVNRYWQKYFGAGLVRTAEDFGVQGEPPSHPQLLDWLATEFFATGWDVAAMQKLIVTSRTYRQQSHVTPRLLQVDPENRLLARGPRLRLSGHAIRDQALFVSGLLVEKTGGPSVSPYQPPDLWEEMSMGMRYRQSHGEDLFRRSLYTIWKRTVAPPAMALFDAADREACWVRRKRTNTPLQALTLLNETGYVECARHLAVRMLREGGDDPIGYGFELVTARRPSGDERRLLSEALAEYRAEFSRDGEAAARLTAVGESGASAELPRPEVAAFTALANVLLNLDETIHRE
jgi:hypothetical protein